MLMYVHVLFCFNHLRSFSIVCSCLQSESAPIALGIVTGSDTMGGILRVSGSGMAQTICRLHCTDTVGISLMFLKYKLHQTAFRKPLARAVRFSA